MSDVAVDAASQDGGAEAPRIIDVDPFSFFGDIASRVSGLGGSAPGHDPTYVFHTPYVQVPPGRASVTMRFVGLRAKQGTLLLRLHMLPLEEGARASMVTSERIKLNRLVLQGGEATIRFDAFRDMSYAVMGRIEDTTDAEAEDLAVRFASEGEPDSRAALAEARPTAFGSETVRPVARLISLDPPRLAEPVSQPCTAGQTAEPTYAAALALLGERHEPGCAQWEAAYILQSLRCYGMVQAGARGLGFAISGGSLPAALAAEGADVLATGHSAVAADGGEMLGSLYRPGLGTRESFDANLDYRPISLAAIPPELVNFDFTWSARATDAFASLAEAFTFLETALACLRPGGLAVHTVSYLMPGEAEGAAGGAIFQRMDLERLALGLISRGHEVAQLKILAADALPIDPTAPGLVTSFGLIARKAMSPI